MPAGAWIINLAVPGIVLETDPGRRTITRFRLARPLLAAGAVIACYLIKTPPRPAAAGWASSWRWPPPASSWAWPPA